MMKQNEIEKIIEEEKLEVLTKEKEKKHQPKPKKKKKKYATQNVKIWTLNFSASKYVARAKVVVQALMMKCGLRSKGLTVLMAVEYCMQERVVKDFLAYVNARHRGLV